MPAATAAPPKGLSNSQARQIVTSQSLTMVQNIYSQTVNPVSNPVLNIVPRNVGIIKRFIVEIVGTLNNTGATPANATDGFLANLLQQCVFIDVNNNTRIQTTGLHLALLQTVKRRRPFYATAQFNTAAGNNLSQCFNVGPATWPVWQGPATINNGAAGTVRAVFEIPLAYSDKDLRGAVFANLINTNMLLQLTLNQNVFAANGTDDSYAVYYPTATGTFTSATVNVYQEYLDQLPMNGGQFILPMDDLNTVYELKNTNLNSVTANQDFPIPFTNFRAFMSAFVMYNNSGIHGGRVYGTDINYLSHTTANFANIFKYDPLYNVGKTREIINSDLPAGVYYFDYREQPVWTTQNGNQQININALTAGAGAYAQVMWEDLALQNTLRGSASLAAS